MSIQLNDIIYSDFSNIIINYLQFEDIISIRCVSKKLYEGRLQEQALSLLLEKGGTQNISRIELIFNHLSTLVQSVQKIFKDDLNNTFSWKITESSSLINYFKIARKFFYEAEIVTIENKIELSDINQILETFKYLKIATINTLTPPSISRISGHSTLQELTIKAPMLQYAPEFYRCDQLRKVNISSCILDEPPKVYDCPKIKDLNYRTRPHEKSI